MNLASLVWKELWERPAAMATSIFAILLGVAAFVGMQHMTIFSENEVARQLDMLGANILVLPQSASLQNYYSADMNGETLPEEHAAQILLANLAGVEKLSPKLCVSAQLAGKTVTLTGVLPQSEFQAKAAWQTISMFDPPATGCKNISCAAKPVSDAPDALASQRTIEKLLDDEAVIGADIANEFALNTGDTIELLGATFRVLTTLPVTGTVDDSRIFAHLHTVQHLAKTGEVVSAIEVLGCCEDAAGDLVPQLRKLLPGCKVLTISQVVQTQVKVNRLMAQASLMVLAVLVLVGGASVLSTVASNVRERRREIGTLMALGATPNFVLRIFLLKAVWQGVAGSLVGSVIGISVAVWLGPAWAGVKVFPLPLVALTACATASLVTLAAAYWPARQASSLDPCTCFQEI